MLEIFRNAISDQKHPQDGHRTARTYVLPSNAIHGHANIDAGDRAFCTLAKG
jgi:hypothetical protein